MAVTGSVLAANAVATAVATTTIGIATTVTVLGTAISIAGVVAGMVTARVLTGALADKPEMPSFGEGSFAQGLLLNKSANDSPIPIVYGTRKVGGTRVFLEATGDNNEYLHMVLAVCEGEVHAINTFWLNDIAYDDSKFSGLLDINTHLGADNQSADSDLVNRVDSWTNAHRLQGTAYLYIRMEYDQDAFQGLPTVTCEVKGRKVYDPRTGTDSTLSTLNNPALCIRDYLTNTRYGRGIDTSLIDDTSFIASANYCDETVTIGGTSKKRYTLDGVVDTSSGSMEILKKLLTSCRGMLVFSGGKYKLIIDKPETAVFTFSEDNIIGAWSITLGHKQNQYNRIRANFFNPERNWQPDIAVADSTALRTLDNGLLLEKTIDLPFTSDIDRAKMITTINLNQSRQQLTVEFTATIEALKCEVGDVVYIKHGTPAWDTLNSNAGKKFRVVRLTLQPNDEIRVLAIEYDADAYDYGTINVSDTTPNTNLPDALTVIAPTGVTASESLYSTIGGAGVKSRVNLSWTSSADVFVREYEVQWKLSSDADYSFHTVTRTTTARFDDVAPNVYDFRVRAINSRGVRSEWASKLNFTAQGLTARPVNVSNFSLVGINNNAHLSWDLATDLDVRVGGKVRFKHNKALSGAQWSTSSDIGTAIAGHNTTAVLPLLDGTYMAKFVDSTGNESETATSFVISNIVNVVNFNAVATTTQHPSFTGTKTNMVAVDDVLKLEADTLIDSITEDIDDWGELIDALGGVDLTGAYEFDNYVDLGANYVSRCTATLDFTAFVLGDFIDDRTALMDTWYDFENFPPDTKVNIYVATTSDDPSGTPTWSDWALFRVADYDARAFKFKLEVEVDNPNHQVWISELSVAIDMPDRVEGERNITTTSGALKTVTYPRAFKEVPALSVSIIDAHSNDLLEITNETATSFDVGVVHGGSYQAHTINYVAKGY